jgi:hypothetical protein
MIPRSSPELLRGRGIHPRREATVQAGMASAWLMSA